MPSTIINGVDLYYECHGKGKPLMLVAGLASDSQSWQPIVDELAQDYLVILLDNRGAGRTKPQNIEISIQHIVDDCIAIIGYLGLSSVTLLGHSMGGLVALDCAIRYPERISRLILVGTSAFNTERNNALFHDWAAYPWLSHKNFTCISIASKAALESANLSIAARKFFGCDLRINSMASPRSNAIT